MHDVGCLCWPTLGKPTRLRPWCGWSQARRPCAGLLVPPCAADWAKQASSSAAMRRVCSVARCCSVPGAGAREAGCCRAVTIAHCAIVMSAMPHEQWRPGSGGVG